MGNGRNDVLFELAIPYVFKHAFENLMYILGRFILNVIVPELSDVVNLKHG